VTPGQLRRLTQELQILDAQLVLGLGSEELQARVVPACLSMKIPRVTDHVIPFRHQADRDTQGPWAEMPIELSPSWPALPMPLVLLCSEIGAVLNDGIATQEVIMSEPFIFIGSYQVKPGHLEEARHRLRDVSALVEEQEPRLRSFHFYLDQARERVIRVQIHPDAESMASHMAVIANHLATAWDWLELGSSTQQVLGVPPRVLTDYARKYNENLDSYPIFVAGFSRDVTEGAVR
jgi:hypothetical protein